MESTPTLNSVQVAAEARNPGDIDPNDTACTRRRSRSIESHNCPPDAKRQRVCESSSSSSSEEICSSSDLPWHSPDDLHDPSGSSHESTTNERVINTVIQIDNVRQSQPLDNHENVADFQTLGSSVATPSHTGYTRVDEVFAIVAWSSEHGDQGTKVLSQHEDDDTILKNDIVEQSPSYEELRQDDLGETDFRGRPLSPTPHRMEAPFVNTKDGNIGADRFDEALRQPNLNVSLGERPHLDYPSGCKIRSFLTEISEFSRQAVDFEITLKSPIDSSTLVPRVQDDIFIDPFQEAVRYTWPKMKRIVAAADLCFSLDLSLLAFTLYAAVLRSPNCVESLGTTSFTQVLMDWALSARTRTQASFARDYVQDYMARTWSLGSVAYALDVVLGYLNERCRASNSGDRLYALAWIRAFRLKNFGTPPLDLIRGSQAFSNFFQPNVFEMTRPLEFVTTVSKTLCFRHMLRRCKQSLSTVQAKAPVVTLDHSFQSSIGDAVHASPPLELLLWIRDLGLNWNKARECKCTQVSELRRCIWDEFLWAELLSVVCRMLYWICRPSQQPEGRMHTSELLAAVDAAIQYSDDKLARLVMIAVIEEKGYARKARNYGEFGDYVQQLVEKIFGLRLASLSKQQTSLSLLCRGRNSVVSNAPTIASSTHSSTYLSFRQTAQRLAESTSRSSAGVGLPSSMLSPSLLSRSSLQSISELSDRFGKALSMSTGADSESISSGDRRSSLSSSQDTRGSRFLSSLRSVRGIKA